MGFLILALIIVLILILILFLIVIRIFWVSGARLNYAIEHDFDKLDELPDSDTMFKKFWIWDIYKFEKRQ